MTHAFQSGGGSAARPVRFAWLAVCLAIALACAAGAYWPAMAARPAGDDFGPPLLEIYRGERLGPAALVAETPQPKNYRPLQSLLMWAAGRGGPAGPTAGRMLRIRLLGLACFAVYLAAFLLWARDLARDAPLRPAAALIGAVLLALHPAQAAAVGSIDGFSTHLSYALMWLGAWAVLRLEGRPILAALATAAAVLVAGAVKEYAFGTVPLAGFVALALWRRRRVGGAAAAFVAGTAAVVALVLLRQAAVPDGAVVHAPVPHLGPLFVARNLALFAAAALFPGNTVWVYLARSPAALAYAAAVAGATVLLLAGGLTLRLRRPSGGESAPLRSARIWSGFLLLAAAACVFPAVVAVATSEMYLPGLLVPLALLAAVAADGWLGVRDRVSRVAVALGLGALLAVMAAADWSKSAGLRDVGERAEVALRSLDAQLPPDAALRAEFAGRPVRVALLFRAADVARRRTYSVYAMADDILISQPPALKWLRPNTPVELEQFVAPDPVASDYPGFDAVYLWDGAAGTFTALNRGAGVAPASQ